MPYLSKTDRFRDFEIHKNKMDKQAEFMKRVFKLAKYWVKRYNIPCKEVTFNYGWIDDQFARNKLTIRLIFHINESEESD